MIVGSPAMLRGLSPKGLSSPSCKHQNHVSCVPCVCVGVFKFQSNFQSNFQSIFQYKAIFFQSIFQSKTKHTISKTIEKNQSCIGD